MQSHNILTNIPPTTISLFFIHHHSHSLVPPPPPHSLRLRLRLSNNHNRHSLLQLFAIRSRDFDYFNTALNIDDNDDDPIRRRKRRRISGKRSRSKHQTPWWSLLLLDDDDDDDGDYDEPKSKTLNLKHVIDNILILKVLTSYGWFLPIIMLSLLLATGAKAFLIAFSVPLGLSLVILAYKKLREWLDDSPKPRRRRKMRPRFSPRNDISIEEDDLEEEIQQRMRNRRRNGPSWVVGSNNGRAGSSNFGGWDELVLESEETRRTRRRSEMDTLKVPVEKKKTNIKSLEERDLPLLLRLLVALFPFLGSWTEFL